MKIWRTHLACLNTCRLSAAGLSAVFADFIIPDNREGRKKKPKAAQELKERDGEKAVKHDKKVRKINGFSYAKNVNMQKVQKKKMKKCTVHFEKKRREEGEKKQGKKRQIDFACLQDVY